MTQRFTRQQLYDLAWSEPKSRLCKRLGISDVGLAKVCKKADIPTPGLGYWAKLDAGKESPKPALPPRGPGMVDWISFDWTGDNEKASAPPNDDEPTFPPINFEPIEEVERRARQVVEKVIAPKSLSNPHRLISRLLHQDEVRLENLKAATYRSPWDGPLFDSQHEQRRLRVINAIALAIDKAGHSVNLRGSEGRELTAHIHDQPVTVKIDWAGKSYGKEKRYTSAEDNKAPHRLRIEIEQHWTKEPPTAWEDTDATLLEDQLTEIIVKMIVTADQQLRDALKQSEEWDQQRRIHKVKMHKEQEVAREKARVEDLHQAAASWQKAREIREYVAAVNKVGASGEITVDDLPLDEWSKWALDHADQIDPICNKSAS